MKRFANRFGLYLALAVAVTTPARAQKPAPADVVVTDAKIYTEDAQRQTVQALAARDGKIVYAGTNAGADQYIGPKTHVERLSGRLLLPGLVDAHIHPVAGIVPLDVCDLKSETKSLAQLTDFARGCIARYHVKSGQWLNVQQWNFSDGNQPDAAHPTVRAALDLASKTIPIQLLGNDGHHSAFNSAALALAKNSQGQTVGFSAATIQRDFPQWVKLIGVDEHGEPNGTINEDAREAMAVPDLLTVNFDAMMKAPERVPELLNRDGITAIQDAAVEPIILPFYDTLAARKQLTVRVNLALLYEPEEFRGPDGKIDYGKIVHQAQLIRQKYASNPLIEAHAVKLFADGVLEGNPFAVPPTLPDSPSIRPYLQPIFGRDAKGNATLKGYVDTGSPLCQEVREHPDSYSSPSEVKKFMAAHGYHPAQCTISSGKLQHDRSVIMAYVKAMHEAGFTVHIHAIGDEAVRTALDAIEAARAADGISTEPDTIAHAQLVSPPDVVRMGKDHIYIAYTYGWADTDPEYDMSVIPFIDHLKDSSFQSLHNPCNYYERQAYPTLSTKKAGAILIAGSDAPVDTRDPRPFFNMALGVTRALPGMPPLGPQERLNIRDLIDAYTINGARALGRQSEIGSLEPGKSADFIVLNQDILNLADSGKAEQIMNTKVLETWFMGREVYAAKTQ